MPGDITQFSIIGKSGKIRKYRLRQKKKDRCSVCLCNLDDISEPECMLNCSHKFHTTCIFNWFKKEPNCPICRSEVSLLNRKDVLAQVPLMIVPPMGVIKDAYKILSSRKTNWEQNVGRKMSDIDMTYAIVIILNEMFGTMSTDLRQVLRDFDTRNR